MSNFEYSSLHFACSQVTSAWNRITASEVQGTHADGSGSVSVVSIDEIQLLNDPIKDFNPHSHAINEMVPPIGNAIYLSAYGDYTRLNNGSSHKVGDGFSISYEAETVRNDPMASQMQLERGAFTTIIYDQTISKLQ